MMHALYLQTLKKVAIVIRDSVQYKDINNTGINLNFQKPNTALLKQPQGVDLNEEEEEAISVFKNRNNPVTHFLETERLIVMILSDELWCLLHLFFKWESFSDDKGTRVSPLVW